MSRPRSDDTVSAAHDSLARIAAADADVRAWVRTVGPAALPVAPDGPLAGVPVGVKDVIDTEDLATERGSELFAGRRPRLDATIVALLRRAGAVVVGKTVTAEFGLFHPNGTRNPHDLSRTPGGSSSGSAAAIGAGHVPLTVGTQTGGSIVRPASYCGAWAIKPTYGSIDRAGMMLHATSVDTLGFLGSSADILDRALRATCWPGVVRGDVAAALSTRLAPVSARPSIITFAEVHNLAELDADAAARIAAAFAQLDATPGVRVTRAAPPFDGAAVDEAAGIVVAYESYEGLAPLVDAHADRVSRAIQDIVVKGAGIDRATYRAALDVGRHAAAQVDSWLADGGLVVAPSAPGVAPVGLGSTGSSAFNRAWSFLGQPCVNVPALTGEHGLPLGLQAIGPRGDDLALLARSAGLHELLTAPQH